MKPSLYCLLLFISASGLHAQGLEIYLDAFKGKTVFVSGKDTLSRPLVKRGEPITLHLLNYNNYLYEVEIEESQRQVTYFSTGIDTSQTGNLAKSAGNSGLDLIGAIMNPSGLLGLGQLASGQLSFLGGMSFSNKGFANDAEESLLLQEMEELEFRYEKVLGEWARIENNLLGIRRDVEELAEIKAIQSMALEEIRKLQYNPNLSVQQIRKLSGEYLDMVFGDRKASDIDMDYLWELHQIGQNLGTFTQQLDAERENYASKLEEIQVLALQHTSIRERIQSPKLMELHGKIDQSMQTALEKGEKELTKLDASYKDLESLSNQFGQENYQELVQLRYMFEELNSNEYTYSYQTTAREDLTQLNVKLSPKENLPSSIRVSERNLANYEVPTRGGLKINGSIGLGFGAFFNPPQVYAVQDSIILANPGDSFVPYLSSFLHFYNYRPGQVAFGGSFGIGIPVFNAQNEQSIAFFLGPSVFLGGAQRITLTGGILGARVERLSNGYQVGDVLKTPALGIPTRGEYQLGYFLGVSINVIGQ